MSDITKRDAAKRAMLKLSSMSSPDRILELPISNVQLLREMLSQKWATFEEQQSIIIARTGIELLEQETAEYDNAFDIYHETASRFDTFIASTQLQAREEIIREENQRKQEGLAELIKNTQTNLDQPLEEMDESSLLVNSKRLDDLYKKFEDLTVSRMASGEDKVAIVNQQKPVLQIYTETAALFHEASVRMRQNNNPLENKHQVQAASTVDDIKVTRLSITKFHGNPVCWEAFRDSYVHSFHLRTNMPNIVKFQHLKSYLEGEAQELVQNIPLSDNNYNAAWNLLLGRYQNPRFLLNAHMNALYRLPHCKESADDLRKLLNKSTSTIQALNNLERPTEHWDDWLVFLITERLDPESRKLWEQSQSESDNFSTWKMLEKFMQSRVRSLESISRARPIPPRNHLSTTRPAVIKVHQSATTTKFSETSTPPKSVCSDCKKNHPLRFCYSFRRRKPTERREIVNRAKLCFNCLQQHHSSATCPSLKRCFHCNGSHHSLLHLNDPPNVTTTSKYTPPTSSSNTTNVHLANSRYSNPKMSSVLLATAIVVAHTSTGETVKLRAMLDSGSTSSFITKSAVEMLKLPSERVNISLIGIAAVSAGSTKTLTTVKLTSCVNSAVTVFVQAYVLPTISKLSKIEFTNNRDWQHLNGIKLADPEFHRQDRIDLLLGSDVYFSLLLNGIRHGSNGEPTAQNTVLGWVLSGPIFFNSVTPSISTANIYHCNLEDQLKRFWELEEVPSANKFTADEKKCDDYFSTTYQRDRNGRFIVRLPYKYDSIELGNSYNTAVIRQLQLEKRFLQNNGLREQYCDFMKKYLDLGHMELASDSFSGLSYYIPHHAVVRPQSSSTKLRVVFNASQKTTNNKCLNEQLHIGPKLQQDLSSIILRWRQHKIVFMADIEKMFRQIFINPLDQNLQRIVWRFNPTDTLQNYCLQTVTYGTSPAPYLAIRTLQQLALEEKAKYPVGAQIIDADVYVDDVLSGAENLSNALDAQRQVQNLLQAGGFILKKWASNHESLLSHLPEDYRECSLPLKFDFEEKIKTLGVQWNPATDEFSFKVNIPTTSKTVTKRILLSESSRLYDPLGWLAPIVITAKLLFQHLWKEKLSWDEPLPESLTQRWIIFRDRLQEISNIKIKRWYGTFGNKQTIQLHGFSDASMVAYAAVVYLRSTNDNITTVTLLTAKTKVAPLKTISLPRLELCGAVLLSQLMGAIKNKLGFDNIETYAWTDSTITLAWIRSDPNRWSVFISNRIAEIQSHLDSNNWQHVKSQDNPADCATHGVLPDMLNDHPLWWNGPSWLVEESNCWPIATYNYETTEELKKVALVHVGKIDDSNWQLIDEISSWNHLVRITSWCTRFCFNARHDHVKRILGHLTTVELMQARNFWIISTQQRYYPTEIRQLTAGSSIGSKSSLLALYPTLDPAKILRVGGRLKNSNLSYDQHHPIIIPRRSTLSNLLIRHAHEVTLHGGTQSTLNYLRQTYWIIDGRNQVRYHIQHCVRCIRFRASNRTQRMADLPMARVTPSRPFLHTAVDFTGAVMVRAHRGRGHVSSKAYIAVFVCLSTRAIHLELVSDLSSAAFIASYRRFISRRGICSDLYSDNGTNFVGANTELQRELQQANTASKVIGLLINIGTNWHFSPPLSPHFNGMAESGVRSVKHHLRRVIGDSTLTYEEMATFLTQVEAVLNSRPLHPMTDDPCDLNVITPGHFLIGESLTTIPEPNLLKVPLNRLQRWQLVQQKYQHFWNRWSTDYLHHLQQRHKWQINKNNLQIGDLVLLKEDNLPPAKWALGRITDTHPGNDGNVRVVTIRSKTGTLKRSINKLIVLPVDQSRPI